MAKKFAKILNKMAQDVHVWSPCKLTRCLLYEVNPLSILPQFGHKYGFFILAADAALGSDDDAMGLQLRFGSAIRSAKAMSLMI